MIDVGDRGKRAETSRVQWSCGGGDKLSRQRQTAQTRTAVVGCMVFAEAMGSVVEAAAFDQ